jgi:hypothetical protein
MTIKLTKNELEQVFRELFKSAVASYADAEDSVVESFIKKVVEKHSAPLLIGGYSSNESRLFVKTPLEVPFGIKPQPQQPYQQRTLFDEAFLAQVEVAEQRI